MNHHISSQLNHHDHLNHLSRSAVLACQAIRTTRAVVASVSSAKEIWVIDRTLVWCRNDRKPNFLFLNVKETCQVHLFNCSWRGLSSTLKVNTLTSNVAQGVRHHVTLARHSVWPLPENNHNFWVPIFCRLKKPGASRENEEEICSPALASGSPETRAVPVRATILKSRFLI